MPSRCRTTLFFYYFWSFRALSYHFLSIGRYDTQHAKSCFLARETCCGEIGDATLEARKGMKMFWSPSRYHVPLRSSQPSVFSPGTTAERAYLLGERVGSATSMSWLALLLRQGAKQQSDKRFSFLFDVPPGARFVHFDGGSQWIVTPLSPFQVSLPDFACGRLPLFARKNANLPRCGELHVHTAAPFRSLAAESIMARKGSLVVTALQDS